MKFFFPDSHDFVDASFDFVAETRSPFRVRQQSDLYPHEVFGTAPYDGLLVSKAIVEGTGNGSGKYSVAQRHRLLRVGVREFFRISGRSLETIGDCGAFTYVKEKVPPFTPKAVIDFYEQCGFDYGLSVDHIILAFRPEHTRFLPDVDIALPEWRERQEITLQLAADFLTECRTRRTAFIPVGVAQGWSASSYAHSVTELQKQGYEYIALGGMVPLKTVDILECLHAVSAVRRPTTRLHLLGISRLESISTFQRYGVVSFDSTAPLVRAFKDEKDNYYTSSRTYTAVRVPQVEGNAELQRRILAGQVDQAEALSCERACLQLLRRYDSEEVSLDEVLDALESYERLFSDKLTRTPANRETLKERPWTRCQCEICKSIGIHVVVFRGAERNRRRGFHNLYVFYSKLRPLLDVSRTDQLPISTLCCSE